MSIEETEKKTRAPIITQARSDSNSNEDLNTNLNELLPKEKNLSQFIKSLTDLVTCPVTLERFKNPATTPSGKVFERETLMKWLRENDNTCPLTRQIIPEQEVNVCHTMKFLIEIMKNQDITSDFPEEMRSERNRVAPRPCLLYTSPSPRD